MTDPTERPAAVAAEPPREGDPRREVPAPDADPSRPDTAVAEGTGEDVPERTIALPQQTVERRVEVVEPAPDDRLATRNEPTAVRADPSPPPQAPMEPQPVPAVTDPLPPRRRGNRLAATARVLLAAGIFEVLYLAALVLYVLIEGGPDAATRSIRPILHLPLTWVPVLIFAVLYELTVLALNRAGRFAYVVTSLIVGLLVYLLTIALVLLIQQGGIGDPRILGQVLIAPQFVLAGLLAREVMLWTGFAVGARGRRLRKRNRQDRDRYEHESDGSE